jgi:hypothetical protein
MRIRRGNVRVRTNVERGARVLSCNHNVRVRTNVKSGMVFGNHNVRVRSSVRSGMIFGNHNVRVRRALGASLSRRGLRVGSNSTRR